MANQVIGLGTFENDGTGDNLRVALDKVNDNFLEIYTLIGDASSLTSGISATATVVTLTAPTISGVVGGTITSATITTLTGTTFNAGTLALSAGSITDSSGAISFGNENLTTTGVVTAASLDISGNVDVDGTLETDALTIDGVSLSETIADTVGAMVSSNTETNITVTYDDADNTLDFVIGTLNQSTSGNAGTATALETARTIHGVSFDGTANIDLSEVVQDTVGAMFSNNTETNITATYQDADGTIDLVIGTLNQDTTGNAATATSLETARTIGGVSFDGSANINLPGVNSAGNQDTSGTAALATTVTVTDSTANTNFPVVFTNESNALLDDTGALRYNPSTGTLLVPNLVVAGTTTQVDTVTMEAANAIVFEGATADIHETTLTITDPTADRTITLPDATGTLALTSDDITGNAATATALETARTIGGVSFDGSANINLPGVNSAGNQNTSGSAATLTTARTIGGVSFDGSANINLPGVNAAGNQNTSGSAATVTGAAQTNITSLGTLTTLTVDNIIVDGTNIGHTSDTDAIAIAANGVVTFSQIPVLPANSIDSDSYVDGSIDTAHIADNSITEAKIANDAISSAELKSLSTLLIKDSGGTTLATFHTAGA